MEFLIFILSTVGLTFIITMSYIFNPLRKKMNVICPVIGKMLHCSQCTGFWSSLLVQFMILIYKRLSFTFYWTDVYYILYGFIGSFICYLIYLLIKPLIDKYD
jgi:uncharacterized membrane protein